MEETASLIVVAGYTHRDGFLDKYEAQLAAANIPFALEPVQPMPDGPNSMTMKRKLAFIREMATRYRQFQRIVISDAFDVQFAGEVPDSMPEQVTFSAEANCYPEPHLAPFFCHPGPWKYVNAGLMVGSPDCMLRWCDLAEQVGELEILDQSWLNRRHAELWKGSVFIDWHTDWFYTVTTRENESIVMHNGRLFNQVHGSAPCFFHFSGKMPDRHFQAMLSGEATSLK